MIDSPYKGLAPYGELDAPLFFGRERESRVLEANVFAAPLTILYGPSGVGKSSLLRAGVTRDLHQKAGCGVVVFDAWNSGDPRAALKQAVAAEVERLALSIPTAEDEQLDVFLARSAEALKRRLVILFDQFEEYLFSYAPSAHSSSFDAVFARAVNGADGAVSYVLAIREDALAQLDRFEARIPQLFDNYLRLDHLERDAARRAITRPLDVYNEQLPASQHVGIEEALIEDIVEQVGAGNVSILGLGADPMHRPAPPGDRVEAAYLQLVMARLWTEKSRHQSRTLQRSTLKTLGGAQEIVRTHLDHVMARLRPRQRAISALIFGQLVTPSGKKIAHTTQDLASYAELALADVQEVVDQLSQPDCRVLRAVAASTADGSTRYEIFHDILAPAIRDWRARFLARSRLPSSLIALAFAFIGGSIAIQLAFPLPTAALLALRGTCLAVLNAVILLQVYRWFVRYLVSTTPAGVVTAYRVPNLGAMLGIVLTMFWLAETTWSPDPNTGASLATLSAGTFLQYSLVVAMLTLFGGFLTLVVVLGAGRLTQRLFANFDAGYYGALVVVCVAIVLLVLATASGLAPVLFPFGPD